MKNYVVLALLLIFACQNKDILVFEIAQHNIVESEFIGIGALSEQYQRFEALKKKASAKELLELSKHQNAAVACYASYALIDSPNFEPLALFSDYLKKDKSVSTVGGCLPDKSSLSVEIYNRYWNSLLLENKDKAKDYAIKDTPDLFQMDSLVLYQNKIESLLLYRALNNRIYERSFSKQIEKLAFDQNELDALVYIYDNMRTGNKERLKTALQQFLVAGNGLSLPKKELENMISELASKE